MVGLSVATKKEAGNADFLQQQQQKKIYHF